MQTDIVTVIKQFTNYIRSRRKGREVRASIADAIDKIAEEAGKAIGTLNGEFHYAGWLHPASGETEVDLNELVPNMIWAVDFSQTDVTYLHKPDGANAASLLLCYGDSSIVYQLVVGLHGSIWSRRYMTSKNIWTAWAGGIDATLSLPDSAADARAVRQAIDQSIAALSDLALTADGALLGTDLDTVTTNSIYALNFGANTYTNAPPGASGIMYLVTMRATDQSGWQVMFGSVGRMFMRRYTVNGWDDWYSLDDRIDRVADPKVAALSAIALTADGALPNNSDLNNVTTNSIHSLNFGANTYTNAPPGASGVMYLITMYATDRSGWQVMYGSAGRMFTRRYNPSQVTTEHPSPWDDWYSLDDRIGRIAIVSNGLTITADNKEQHFTDFNDAPLNEIIWINKGAALANSPFGYGMSTASGVYDGTYRDVAGYIDGTLLTCGSSTYKFQLFVSGRNKSGTPPNEATVFYRAYYSQPSPIWGEWRCASDLRSPTSTNIAIRRKFIGRWLDKDPATVKEDDPPEMQPKAVNTETPWLNDQYMSDYLAPYIATIDGKQKPVPIDKGQGENPNYQTSHKFFTDFNDAPFNSIYQIDKDCTAEVMARNPRPGKSSVLITTGFSWAGRQHGKVQICVGTDSGTFAYIRYGYENDPTRYIWTTWLQIADASKVAALEARVAALEAQVAALGG